MVLVMEPAMTPVDVTVVTWPSTVVVMVVRSFGTASVAGTTEKTVTKEGTTVWTVVVTSIGFVATGTDGSALATARKTPTAKAQKPLCSHIVPVAPKSRAALITQGCSEVAKA